MDLANHQFGEIANVAQGLLQGTQLDAAANNGLWISMRDYVKAVVVVETSGGTRGDDLVISVNQATSNTGTSSKSLACVQRWYIMQAATLNQSAGGIYALTTQTLAASFTATGSAGQQSLVIFEIDSSYLDATDGFYFVQASIAQTAHSALGQMKYLLFTRHPQSIPVSPLS
jgi:hypothetical protein